MEQKKQRSRTKRAMYLSAISMMLCLVMLMGTTFAWFTDAIGSKGNAISSGNLKVAAKSYDANESTIDYWDPVTGTVEKLRVGDGADVTTENLITNNGTLFTEQYFEPNKSGAKYIAVKNTGSLPVDLIIEVKLNDANLGKTPSVANMAEVLKMSVDAVANLTLGSAPASWAGIKTLADPGVNFNGRIYDSSLLSATLPNGLLPGDEVALRLDYYMCAWAGNQYQNQKLDVDFGIVAVQHNTYGYKNSLGSTYSEYKLIYTAQDFIDALTETNANPGWTLILMNDVTMPWGIYTFSAPVNIDLNGHKLTFAANSELHFNYTGLVPCAMEIANGTIDISAIYFNTGVAAINVPPSCITDANIPNLETPTAPYDKWHVNPTPIGATPPTPPTPPSTGVTDAATFRQYTTLGGTMPIIASFSVPYADRNAGLFYIGSTPLTIEGYGNKITNFDPAHTSDSQQMGLMLIASNTPANAVLTVNNLNFEGNNSALRFQNYSNGTINYNGGSLTAHSGTASTGGLVHFENGANNTVTITGATIYLPTGNLVTNYHSNGNTVSFVNCTFVFGEYGSTNVVLSPSSAVSGPADVLTALGGGHLNFGEGGTGNTVNVTMNGTTYTIFSN